MRIAVLSGKGGTGKTLMAVNLATVAKTATYLDCDVEEPNGHLFFKPTDVWEEEITVKIPRVENVLCNGCRKCVDFCKFNALAYIKDKLLIFEEVCHSCGGCMIVCPEKALTEKEKVIGKVQKGISGGVKVYTGILNTGEASGIPIIKKLLIEDQPDADCPADQPATDKADVDNSNTDHSDADKADADKWTLVDCPPGSACIVMESIKDADYCLLVAEPTIFGVHNLKMVYDLVRIFGKRYGVVLNKCLEGENPAEKFCAEKNIKILGRIPFDHELGALNSNAEIVVRKNKKYRTLFSTLLETVKKEVQNETATHS